MKYYLKNGNNICKNNLVFKDTFFFMFELTARRGLFLNCLYITLITVPVFIQFVSVFNNNNYCNRL